MSKSDTFENDFLKLIFNATPIAGIADNAATSPLTNLYLALHTADPTDAGNQSSSEVAYTGYARVAVARNSSGFTVAANVVTTAANNDFPKATGGAATATHFSIGTASTGTGKILYKGTITPNYAIANGSIPRLEAGTSVTED